MSARERTGAPRAALLTVGDELLAGTTVDTNSSLMARTLFGLGLEVGCMHTVGDEEEAIARVMLELARDYDCLLVTGGLGPTLDDLTRQALARAAGVEVHMDPVALGYVRSWFDRAGYTWREANARQGLVPVGGRPLENALGTAPGLAFTLQGTPVLLLPGPPREMLPMLEGAGAAFLAELVAQAGASASAEFFLYGLPESEFAGLAGEWMERSQNPALGVCASRGVLTATLRSRAADREEADRLLERRRIEFRTRFAAWIFSEEQGDLARLVVELAHAQGVTLTLAESCTVGLITSKLGAVPGASAVLQEALVTYANRAKVARLGVDPELIEQHGAVSEPVARAMALGARERSGADLALAVTGIAGPTGGSEAKPVGTVWFAVAGPHGTETLQRHFRGNREAVREYAAQAALDLLRRQLA